MFTGVKATLKNTPRLIAFGFLHALCSGFGQTFFVALFYTAWLEEFQTNRMLLGQYYGLATLCSGLMLPFISPLIDHFSPRRSSLIILAALLLAIIILIHAPHLLGLAIGFFFLRISGQGLMLTLANTTVAKRLDRTRGKALSMVALGSPLGEAILPVIFVLIIQGFGWQTAWWTVAFVLLLAVTPNVLFLTRSPLEVDLSKTTEHVANANLDWRRREVVSASPFWLMLLFWVMPAFLFTGFLFHKLSLASERQWPLTFMASTFVAYAIARMCASFFAGPLADRFSASTMLIWSFMPMPIGFAVLLIPTQELWALVIYLSCMGLALGANGTVKSIYLADHYGTKHMAAIKGLLTACSVVATSISPWLFGYWLESGWSFQEIAFFAVCCCVISIILAAFGKSRLNSLNQRRKIR